MKTPRLKLLQPSFVIVNYHELGLKGKNRSSFENRLLFNIRDILCVNLQDSQAPPKSKRISGRILIGSFEQAEHAQRYAQIVAKIAGVAKTQVAYQCGHNIDEIVSLALEVMTLSLPEIGCDAAIYSAAPCKPDVIASGAERSVAIHFDTVNSIKFRVTARRSNTGFAMHSNELAGLVGSRIKQVYPDLIVNLKDYDINLCIDVVEQYVYIYADSIPGIGGLPTDKSCKMVALLSSGIDSPVAAWQLMRRGAYVSLLHFSGWPETPPTSKGIVFALSEVLQQSGGAANLKIVDFGTYQRAIYESAAENLRIMLYRRLMLAVAEGYALQIGAQALITGESLGQVASQTITNIAAIDSSVGLPIFRPLIGTDKREIIDLAQRIDTYDLSISVAEDCCTLFAPQHPSTGVSLALFERAWSALPADKWIAEMLA